MVFANHMALIYLLWHIFWLGWNIFLICLYLNVAGLDHEKNKVLKLDLNSDSWWKKEGPGCKVKDIDAIPVEYEGCLIDYVHVEIVQAVIQSFFALLNTIMGIWLSRIFLEEDDTFNFEKPDGPDNILLHPMYVNPNDNLQSSNRFINLAPNKYVLSDGVNSKLTHLRVDAIRYPQRSNSFNSINKIASKGSIRPKSVCTDDYYC
ncbi:unnamed protein product [Acanthoscelides obtectus]|uniref:Sodium/potassium-transporting ATPase subunit beta-1-interacting protein n=1 Tax=Acanthoscelides obtectus TaxID=200917 RepID=A0A9P0KZ59_ACAOB|nr:unnamed protein product [Acanthoscelides obtectus]CAK1627803.1 Sodium/potassium-transporting ATPase subunit beta-1-interacting protein [Acanthoscelides obtectus]